MKYSAQVFEHMMNGPQRVHQAPFEFEAKDDHAAANAARKAHLVPDEGGHFEVVVTCLETTTRKAWEPVEGDAAGRFADSTWIPPYEVSRFSVSHEPAAHVAEAVYAQRAKAADAAAEAAKVAAIREQVIADIRSGKVSL